MLVIVSRKVSEKNPIYHKTKCIYAMRIKDDNRIETSPRQCRKRGVGECKYCGGLKGDIRVSKENIEVWKKKYKTKITYEPVEDVVYIQTNIGFWKIIRNLEIEKYILYHRNDYDGEIRYDEAIRGRFHRQVDQKPSESFEKLAEYVIAHDQAKVIIQDDYHKLPRQTRKQKDYYKQARKREIRKEIARLDDIFEMIKKN